LFDVDEEAAVSGDHCAHCAAAAGPVAASRPAGDPLRSLSAALADLAESDVTAVPVTSLGEQITAIGQLLHQLEGERLRRLAVFDRAGGATADGATTTTTWLRERAGLAPGAARERVVVARELADARPLTAAALAAGRISYTAAKEIALGLRDAPGCVPAEAVAAVEPVLLTQAPALAPGDIRRLLTRALQALAPDSLLAREQQAHDRRGVRLSPLGDGWHLSGDLTGECGAALDTALRALVAAQPALDSGEPRPSLAQRRHDAVHALARQLLDSGALPEQVLDDGGLSEQVLNDGVAQRTLDDAAHPGTQRGEQADRPADQASADPGPIRPGREPAQDVLRAVPARLPDISGERPHLLVLTDITTLHATGPGGGSHPPGTIGGPLPPLAELHGSGPVSSHLARRLACDASVTRVLVQTAPPAAGARPPDPGPGLNPDVGPHLDLDTVRALLPPALGGPVSQVVDVGRRHRVVPPATRRAVLARDRGCRWPGCAAPISDSEVHHLWHWSDGGPTDLWNLLLLCWPHHRLLHEGRWTLRLRSDGTVVLRRPDGTPVRGLAA
jgi:hypothetical protein